MANGPLLRPIRSTIVMLRVSISPLLSPQRSVLVILVLSIILNGLSVNVWLLVTVRRRRWLHRQRLKQVLAAFTI